MPSALPVDYDGQHWWMDFEGRSLRLSNLDKVFWPSDKYTKGDLLTYYFNVADLILPYLKDRPLTMKRMPQGIGGPFFYAKQAPAHVPDWIPRCRISKDEGGSTEYIVVQEKAAILLVANLGCIEFHPLHSRCDSLEQPDYLFFDLDPFPPATYGDVLAVALHVRAAAEALGWTVYPKTSGATGMQIYLGLSSGPGYEEVREIVSRIGKAILKADPERVTMQWDVKKRDGRVFIDHNMNRQGANLAAPYSVRPESGAPVSTPVTWDEVEAGVHPQDFRMPNVHERFATLGDLFRPVLDDHVDISPALSQFGIRSSEPSSAGQPRSSSEAKLKEYRRKRDFSQTAEPQPEEAPGSGRRFVIQKHNATRLHYDLRLERHGVLESWAVPKGLPIRPGDKRLAVQTEPHPKEYGSFEGWIPKGEYGGGEVRIFDSGTFDIIEWTDSKVAFILHGRRHVGEYHMVKTKERDWLIFLAKSSVSAQPESPPEFKPMLADPGHLPFDDPAWRFEPKMDGVRTLAYIKTDSTRLVSRSGKDQTAKYPELSRLAGYVNVLSAVVDGEIVSLDEQGRPSFERLQTRITMASEREIERASKQAPVFIYLFDVLWLDGEDLTESPLRRRRELLEQIVTQDGPVRLTFFSDGEGRKFFEAAKLHKLEGVIGKRLDSAYFPGKRSKDWRKMKALNRQDCVVLGWTKGAGTRSRSFGSLLVGAYRGTRLEWIGQVGTGFTDAFMSEWVPRIASLEVPSPPAVDITGAPKSSRWVRAELVCEVEYLEMTSAGKMRGPSFKGFREDKLPEDCILELPDGDPDQKEGS